jgi:type IV pilus assembly protein PilY1
MPIADRVLGHLSLSEGKKTLPKMKMNAYSVLISFLVVAAYFSPAVILGEGDIDQGILSRSSPVVQANILYSGYSDTVSTGQEKLPRGHVAATTIYDPVDPGHTEKVQIWDAGEVLSKMEPVDRKIYVPDIKVLKMTDVTIEKADGSTRTFSGTLLHPIIYSTVRITDGKETFNDLHIKDLTGNLGGTGTINRFTGVFEVTFNEPPAEGEFVKCSYRYYVAGPSMVEFNKDNIGNDSLGLNNTLVGPGKYQYDLDVNSAFDEADGDYLVGWVRGYQDGVSAKKKWLFGPVDHSVPAIAGPPGRPNWYYGTDITKDEKEEFDSFLAVQKDRRNVLYVGALDGMIHAFDAGRFCWGDNPETAVTEKRGYFTWVALSADPLLNERWRILLAFNPDQPQGALWQTTGKGDKAPDYGGGRELWAFIPPNLIPRLKNNMSDAEDQAYVDASPAIADVYINGAWATVLVAGEGIGGDHVFCLDITDPDKPRFLWEFADPGLLRSRSCPTSAQIGKILVAGVKRWVAFLTSGDIFCTDLDPSLYIIDIADGAVVSRVFLHAGMDRNGDNIDDGKGGIPCAQPAVIDSDGNGYIDRVYVGTDKGFVFKVNIPDDSDMPQCDFESCIINTNFFYKDSLGVAHSVPPDQQFHPIVASPTVVVDNDYDKDGVSNYNIRLFFGTSASDHPNHFFAYADHNSKGVCNAASISIEWFYQLPDGNVIVTSSVAAAGAVYLGTSTDEAGDVGAGRIYVYDMLGGKVIFEKEIGDITATPLVEEEHLYVKTSSSGTSPVIIGGGKYNNDTVKIPSAKAGIQAWKEIW